LIALLDQDPPAETPPSFAMGCDALDLRRAQRRKSSSRRSAVSDALSGMGRVVLITKLA